MASRAQYRAGAPQVFAHDNPTLVLASDRCASVPIQPDVAHSSSTVNSEPRGRADACIRAVDTDRSASGLVEGTNYGHSCGYGPGAATDAQTDRALHRSLRRRRHHRTCRGRLACDPGSRAIAEHDVGPRTPKRHRATTRPYPAAPGSPAIPATGPREITASTRAKSRYRAQTRSIHGPAPARLHGFHEVIERPRLPASK